MFIMRSNIHHIVYFLVATLLALPYGHANNKERISLEARDEDEEPCPTGRAVCSAGKGHSRFVRLARDTVLGPIMKLPADPEFKNDMDKFHVRADETCFEWHIRRRDLHGNIQYTWSEPS